MLTIDVLVKYIPVLILALAAPVSLAHFLSLQTELKPVRVRISERTVHWR